MADSDDCPGGVDISVVIPCRNGAPFLRKQLDAVLSQRTNAVFEVVVADNGSTDDTVDAIRSYDDPRVRLVDAGGRIGANFARNVGVAAARGGVILLTDADDVVQGGWIEAYRVAFRNGVQAAGGGLDRVLDGGRVLARERRLYRATIGSISFANGTNCVFTRAVFDAVGGFDETFKGGADEVDFFWRIADAGYALELVTDAVVCKLQRADLGEAFQQYFNFGRGEAQLVHKFRPRLLVIATGIAMVQAVLWATIRATISRVVPASHRKAACALAWNLGLWSEGVRLLEKSPATAEAR
ncbi:glycosyltransferase family 2 protein [Mycobacterium sp. BMJ-28]